MGPQQGHSRDCCSTAAPNMQLPSNNQSQTISLTAAAEPLLAEPLTAQQSRPPDCYSKALPNKTLTAAARLVPVCSSSCSAWPLTMPRVIAWQPLGPCCCSSSSRAALQPPCWPLAALLLPRVCFCTCLACALPFPESCGTRKAQHFLFPMSWFLCLKGGGSYSVLDSLIL